MATALVMMMPNDATLDPDQQSDEAEEPTEPAPQTQERRSPIWWTST